MSPVDCDENQNSVCQAVYFAMCEKIPLSYAFTSTFNQEMLSSENK